MREESLLCNSSMLWSLYQDFTRAPAVPYQGFKGRGGTIPPQHPRQQQLLESHPYSKGWCHFLWSIQLLSQFKYSLLSCITLTHWFLLCFSQTKATQTWCRKLKQILHLAGKTHLFYSKPNISFGVQHTFLFLLLLRPCKFPYTFYKKPLQFPVFAASPHLWIPFKSAWLLFKLQFHLLPL